MTWRAEGDLCQVVDSATRPGMWRSGVLFLLDTKPSQDGESVIRVYRKKWDF